MWNNLSSLRPKKLDYSNFAKWIKKDANTLIPKLFSKTNGNSQNMCSSGCFQHVWMKKVRETEDIKVQRAQRGLFLTTAAILSSSGSEFVQYGSNNFVLGQQWIVPENVFHWIRPGSDLQMYLGIWSVTVWQLNFAKVKDQNCCLIF